VKLKLPKTFQKITRAQWTYGGILIGFVIWMIFLDTNSLLIHHQLNAEIEQLENEKEGLIKTIQQDQKALEQFKNLDSLEKFARENYGHKKENEAVYLIEYRDSI
jgi:cell division protein DivIC